MSSLSAGGFGPFDGMSGTDGMSGADGMSGTDGMSGVGRQVPPGAAINSSLVAAALIRTRDGIVGGWKRPEPEANPSIGRPERLSRWSPDMRAVIFEGELLSRLAFGHDASGSAFVWHGKADAAATAWDRPPTQQYLPLVAIGRPSDIVFNRQLDLMHAYADLRSDRLTEILAQLGDPFAFFGSIAHVHAARHPNTLTLLRLALRLSHFTVQRLKHTLACLRPSDLSPQIQPVIQVPGHSALPSGHATEAFICAIVFYRLLKSCRRADARMGTQFMRLAARIAINRTIAGVHFPVDSVAGAVLGLTLGQYLVARATEGKQYQAWAFNGSNYPEDADFRWWQQYDPANDSQTQVDNYVVKHSDQSDESLGSPMLNWLWRRAGAEWTSENA